MLIMFGKTLYISFLLILVIKILEKSVDGYESDHMAQKSSPKAFVDAEIGSALCSYS